MKEASRSKVIFVHPLGNENVRAAATGLASMGRLARFYTSVAGYPGSFFGRLGQLKPFADFKRRNIDAKLAPFLRLFPTRELLRLACTKLGIKALIENEDAPLSVDTVYRSLDKRVAKEMQSFKENGIRILYAYEDGSLESFTEAKRYGIKCIYDLPIGYWGAMHQMLQQEIHTRPEWASTIDGFGDSKKKLIRKDQELRLADEVFVASTFTAQTLKSYSGGVKNIKIIPYGFPEVATDKVYKPFNNRKLELLYVGALSQRKGIANLFESLEDLHGKVNLTLVGRKIGPGCHALDKQLKQHKWIPSLPHNEVLDLMKSSDVLIFPSLFEGFGLVITEAMSQGTPVITTERTAGPDFIVSDVNGWIVEAGNTSALRDNILDLLNNPGKIERNGRAALSTALSRPWSTYGEELYNAVEEVLEKRS